MWIERYKQQIDTGGDHKEYAMTKFVIRVAYQAPYPVEKVYDENRSSLPAAIGSALRRWRKDLKGKRISEVTVKATRLYESQV